MAKHLKSEHLLQSLYMRTLTRGVVREAWLSRPVLVRPLWVGTLRVGHLRVGHLRVGTWCKAWTGRREAWLAVASCWWVSPPRCLAVVRRGHAEPWLRGSVHVVVKRVGFTHAGVHVLVLRHGTGLNLLTT